MAVLVCGGAGYIGSHINKQLHKEGYETIVFDNLFRWFWMRRVADGKILKCLGQIMKRWMEAV